MIKVSLTKRPIKRDGKHIHFWTLRWFDAAGRRRSESLGRVGTITKALAESRRHEKEYQLNAGLIQLDGHPALTLNELIEHDIQAIRHDVTRATAESVRHAGNHAVAALGRDFQVNEMTRAHVGRIKAHIIEELGRSPATMAKSMRVLRAVFNRAKQEGLLTDNPFTGVRLPKVQARSKRIVSSDEMAALVDACPSTWWRCFLLGAASTGLRTSELLNTLWSDIDFDAGVVRVSAKRKGRFSVAGRGEYPVLEFSTKSHLERAVPVPEVVLRALAGFQSESDGSAYVFLSLDRLAKLDARLQNGGLGPNTPLVCNMTRQFQAIQDAARVCLARDRGLGSDADCLPYISLHDLRRTSLTCLARAVPSHVLREFAGHASIATSAQFYLAAEGSDAERARAAMSVMLGSKVKD